MGNSSSICADKKSIKVHDEKYIQKNGYVNLFKIYLSNNYVMKFYEKKNETHPATSH